MKAVVEANAAHLVYCVVVVCEVCSHLLRTWCTSICNVREMPARIFFRKFQLAVPICMRVPT